MAGISWQLEAIDGGLMQISHSRRVIDTNILINHWRRMSQNANWDQVTRVTVHVWADRLIKMESSNLILTPIGIEFLCGFTYHLEMQFAKDFLLKFQFADGGEIRSEDWSNALSLAERIPQNQKRRQLGDCLIASICKRLRLLISTADFNFPRS